MTRSGRASSRPRVQYPVEADLSPPVPLPPILAPMSQMVRLPDGTVFPVTQDPHSGKISTRCDICGSSIQLSAHLNVYNLERHRNSIQCLANKAKRERDAQATEAAEALARQFNVQLPSRASSTSRRAGTLGQNQRGRRSGA